jgi:hypothetical protein
MNIILLNLGLILNVLVAGSFIIVVCAGVVELKQFLSENRQLLHLPLPLCFDELDAEDLYKVSCQ